jgi:hypothetical protein
MSEFLGSLKNAITDLNVLELTSSMWKTIRRDLANGNAEMIEKWESKQLQRLVISDQVEIFAPNPAEDIPPNLVVLSTTHGSVENEYTDAMETEDGFWPDSGSLPDDIYEPLTLPPRSLSPSPERVTVASETGSKLRFFSTNQRAEEYALVQIPSPEADTHSIVPTGLADPDPASNRTDIQNEDGHYREVADTSSNSNSKMTSFPDEVETHPEEQVLAQSPTGAESLFEG